MTLELTRLPLEELMKVREIIGIGPDDEIDVLGELVFFYIFFSEPPHLSALNYETFCRVRLYMYHTGMPGLLCLREC